MADCAAGTVDSQGISLWVKGGPFANQVEVGDVLNIPIPGSERQTDDVTPVGAKFAEVLAAGVITNAPLDVTLLQRTNNNQQAQLYEAYILGACLDWEIKLPDEAKTSYTFCGSISKFAPTREANKKNRVNFTIATSGEVDWLENGISVLEIPEDASST